MSHPSENAADHPANANQAATPPERKPEAAAPPDDKPRVINGANPTGANPGSDQPGDNPPAEAPPKPSQTQSAPPQQAPAPTPDKPAPTKPEPLSAEVAAEVDEAMAAMDRDEAAAAKAQSKSQPKPNQPKPQDPAKPTTPGLAPEKPRLRGPRKVVGGREIRAGVVASVGPEDVFVEFGPKELGVVQRTAFTDDKVPTQGDTIEVIVERFNANEQLYICAVPGAVTKAEWEMLEPGQVVEAIVKGQNKGGLECEVANHRAFMPASQIDTRRVEDFTPYVGEKLKCEVTKIDRAGHGNIVLSRRKILDAERKEQLGQLKQSLAEGQTVEGPIVRIMDFGAFVDLGGVDGLVHVSDISHDRIRNPGSVVSVGQVVKAVVLKIDWAKERISLGMKQCMEDPFQTASNEITPGETISGKVTKLMEFGAFVELAPGVEGLVHISEMAWKRIARVDSVVKQDEIVTVKVLDVDPEKRRISLSIKQTTEPPKNMRGKGEEGLSLEEIQKVTPQERRLREEFKKKHKKQDDLKSGLGGEADVDLGEGLGSLRLG